MKIERAAQRTQCQHFFLTQVVPSPKEKKVSCFLAIIPFLTAHTQRLWCKICARLSLGLPRGQHNQCERQIRTWHNNKQNALDFFLSRRHHSNTRLNRLREEDL